MSIHTYSQVRLLFGLLFISPLLLLTTEMIQRSPITIHLERKVSSTGLSKETREKTFYSGLLLVAHMYARMTIMDIHCSFLTVAEIFVHFHSVILHLLTFSLYTAPSVSPFCVVVHTIKHLFLRTGKIEMVPATREHNFSTFSSFSRNNTHAFTRNDIVSQKKKKRGLVWCCYTAYMLVIPKWRKIYRR